MSTRLIAVTLCALLCPAARGSFAIPNPKLSSRASAAEDSWLDEARADLRITWRGAGGAVHGARLADVDLLAAGPVPVPPGAWLTVEIELEDLRWTADLAGDPCVGALDAASVRLRFTEAYEATAGAALDLEPAAWLAEPVEALGACDPTDPDLRDALRATLEQALALTLDADGDGELSAWERSSAVVARPERR